MSEKPKSKKTNSNTRVLLLFPNQSIISEPCCEGYNESKIIPYELATVATALRTDFDVKVLDAKAESLSQEAIKKSIRAFNPDIFVLWTVTITYRKDIPLLQYAKSLGAQAFLVMNPPILLKQVLERFPFIDAAIHLERHIVIKQLADAFASGKAYDKITGIVFRSRNNVKDNGPPKIDASCSHPKAAFDLLPMEKYTTDNVVLKSSTGCPYQCTFCFWGNSKWKTNTVNQTLDEIELLVNKYGAKNIGFSEQHFTLDKRRVYEFCDEVEKRKLKFKWFCDSRVEHVDAELLKRMQEAGLSRIFYGVEHINNKILENMNKHQTKEQIVNTINLTKAQKIPFVLPFIVGLPGETEQTIKELKKFIIEIKPWNYHVLFPVPYPGTALFKQAKENNWLRVEEKPENFWVSPDFYKPLMVVPPMTEEKLIRARRMLLFAPRLHPEILFNTVRDVYRRGGITKLYQLFQGGMRVSLGRSVQ